MEYCLCVQWVREMVSVQVNQLKCNLNQNRKNSQKSSSDYCNLIKLKDDIDWLLLGPGHDIIMQIHKQMQFSGVADENLKHFSIYLYFTCTIGWNHTYLVLLYPKDQMITLKTQKYLYKLMHVVHPAPFQWYIWCIPAVY